MCGKTVDMNSSNYETINTNACNNMWIFVLRIACAKHARRKQI